MLPLGLSQLDTVVLPEHRGRGLALAVKSAAADLVHHEHPDLDVISSTISADNKAMLATSRRLGWMETHRRLLVELG